LNAPRDEFGQVSVGQTAKCYHIRAKREARAARHWQTEKGLRRNFFKPGDWDNFRPVALQRTACSTGRRYRQPSFG
jgi:hypothetical protein